MKVKRGCLRGVGGRPAQVKGNTIASGGVSGDFYGGSAPLVKISVHLGGSTHRNSCIGLAFQSLLVLLPKCYD